MAKCNLTNEEQAKVLQSKLWWGQSMEDWEKLRSLFHNYIFLTNYEDGADWRCSGCHERGFFPKKILRINPKKHNDYIQCPSCGERYQIKNTARVKSGAKLHQTLAVSFVKCGEDGALYIESGVGTYDYNEDYYDMEEGFLAKRRYYIAQGKVQGWKRGLNYDWFSRAWSANPYHPGDWEPTVNICEPFTMNPLYGFDGYGNFIGMESILNSQLKYCAIAEHYANYHNIEDVFDYRALVRLVPQYLAEYALHPSIEMVVKLQLSEFVGELVREHKANARDVNWNAKRPNEFCRLTPQEFKILRPVLSPTALNLYHALKKSGKVSGPEDGARVLGIGRENIIKTCLSLCEKLGADIVELARYLEKGGKNASIWADYITAATQLGYDLKDMTVLFPKNLDERHDSAVKACRYRADAEEQKKYKARKKSLEKKYSFEAGGYRIIVPESAEEIIAEGKTLHHCVGGYADRHIKGKTTILFLRKARTPQRSFLTIELDENGNLRQIHGYKNERYPYAKNPLNVYGWLIDLWQRWYRRGSRRDENGKPIIEEEKTA